MIKRLSKTPQEKRMKKPACPSFTRNENDLWHNLCDGTREKFCTIEPVHTALSAPSKEFLANYIKIFGHK